MENKVKGEKMAELNLEVSVVVTEKMTTKKEYERVEREYKKMHNDYKDYRTRYDELQDNHAKTNKLNSEFRGLILDNQSKLLQLGQDIQLFQKTIESKNKQVNRAKDEAKVFEKQVISLEEKLKEKSDTETYEDEEEMKKNEKKAKEAEKYKADLAQL
mmetsp:Transcript_28419/g.43023  ORF Transcript_28419/g.43023 Transcript_28419/m.43023 type:complete len:158 (-) Transcript_28419:454-927(-)|eukprot:CAMPEP_0170512220 /NCGR_PEP_ID=MMETSP0208-20121228/66730_1 /TAXON_ID=197538 /ORGANISM="Strombidium inclinatum, Strain S3" /LENGTH=157 /DNA_ID=CAMNT_0010795829 /DNA_START=570 /DNA_END=1043 /DNA_ORIENTATION=+